MNKFVLSAIAVLGCAINTAHAVDMPTSTKRVENAVQFKDETTKHYDKLFYLSEIKLKKQKTSKEKAYTACVEIPKAMSDVIRFNNVNKSLFDANTQKNIDKHNHDLTAKNQDMFLKLNCNDAIKHYKFGL